MTTSTVYAGQHHKHRRNYRHASFQDPTWTRAWNLGIPAFMLAVIVLLLLPYGGLLVMMLTLVGTVLIVRRLTSHSGRHRAPFRMNESFDPEVIEPERVLSPQEPVVALPAEPVGVSYGITDVPPPQRFNLTTMLPNRLVFSTALTAYWGYEMLRQQYWKAYVGPAQWDQANARAQRPWRPE